MRGGVTAGVASVTPLLSTPTLSVGEFHCPPGDASWHETNRIGDRAHVVFPRWSVLIRQLGRESVLATPNHAMLYNADQHYRRELQHELGDESVFVELAKETLEQLAGDDRLHATHVPTGRRDLPAPAPARAPSARPLLRRARGRGAGLQARAVGPRAPGRPRRPSRERTNADHRELAESAKSEIASDLSVRRSLGELARKLHTSPFHLARVFRAETGFTLAGYRQALRLRAALERLPGNDRDLSALALELGFSSHSHFTASFTREFGVPPTAVKDPRRSPRTARRGLAGLASSGRARRSRRPGHQLDPPAGRGRRRRARRGGRAPSEITRLGEGVDERRKLLPLPVARVRNVLSDYRRELERLGAERVLAIATSAVRDAENGEAFLGEIEWSYGFTTRLVTRRRGGRADPPRRRHRRARSTRGRSCSTSAAARPS